MFPLNNPLNPDLRQLLASYAPQAMVQVEPELTRLATDALIREHELKYQCRAKHLEPPDFDIRSEKLRCRRPWSFLRVDDKNPCCPPSEIKSEEDFKTIYEELIPRRKKDVKLFTSSYRGPLKLEAISKEWPKIQLNAQYNEQYPEKKYDDSIDFEYAVDDTLIPINIMTEMRPKKGLRVWKVWKPEWHELLDILLQNGTDLEVANAILPLYYSSDQSARGKLKTLSERGIFNRDIKSWLEKFGRNKTLITKLMEDELNREIFAESSHP